MRSSDEVDELLKRMGNTNYSTPSELEVLVIFLKGVRILVGLISDNLIFCLLLLKEIWILFKNFHLQFRATVSKSSSYWSLLG